MIRVYKSSVMSALKVVMQMTDAKADDQVRRCLALEAKDSFLTIQATDLRNTMEIKVACEGVLPLTVVNAKGFYRTFDASATRQRGRYSPDKAVLIGVRDRRQGSPGTLDMSGDEQLSMACCPRSLWPRDLPIVGPDQTQFDAPLLKDALEYVQQTGPKHVWFAKDGSIYADNGDTDMPMLSVGDDTPARIGGCALEVLLGSIEAYKPQDVLAAMVPNAGCRFTFLTGHGSVSVHSRA